jgi:hypothetical protein
LLSEKGNDLIGCDLHNIRESNGIAHIAKNGDVFCDLDPYLLHDVLRVMLIAKDVQYFFENGFFVLSVDPFKFGLIRFAVDQGKIE